MQNRLLLVVVATTALRASCMVSVGNAKELEVGAAKVDITPPVGFRKAGGYSEIISTGVHDPLFAKSLVVKQGEVAIALVVCDLLSVPAPLSAKARALASARTGIPKTNIIIAATHNHGSPEYWGPLRDVFHRAATKKLGRDPHESVDYQKAVVNGCVKSIERAYSARVVATGQVVVASQQGLAFNRRFHMRDGTVRFNPGRGNPDIVRSAGPVDTELPFLLFRARGEGRAAIASLTVFAMHTAVFGGKEFGADFPGHLQTGLGQHFGPKYISIFAEGTAGDINHIDVRKKGRSVPGESRMIGQTLTKTVLKHLPLSRPLVQPSLSVKSETVFAPFVPVNKQQFQRASALLASQSTVRVPFMELVDAWRDCQRFHHAQQYGRKKPLEVQAIRLNKDTAIVSLPHEIFVEIGIAIKASSPFRNTIVLSLANDVDYYIPTRRAFEEGSYEVRTCPLNPGCGELLTNCAIRLLNSLKASR